jgi:hypothetical protein
VSKESDSPRPRERKDAPDRSSRPSPRPLLPQRSACPQASKYCLCYNANTIGPMEADLPDGVGGKPLWQHPGFGRYGTAAVGARSASRLAWIPYAARRSCPTPLCRWLRSACSAIRAQCWAKLSRESNVSGSKVTSAIFRQSHATSLYSSAAFIGIAKALLCASPVPCARNRPWAFAVPGPDLKISNGMSFGTGALPKFMSGSRSSRSQLTQEAARCRRPLSSVAFCRSYGRASI